MPHRIIFLNRDSEVWRALSEANNEIPRGFWGLRYTRRGLSLKCIRWRINSTLFTLCLLAENVWVPYSVSHSCVLGRTLLKGLCDYISLHFAQGLRCIRLDILVLCSSCSVDKINFLNMSETPKLPAAPSQ